LTARPAAATVATKWSPRTEERLERFTQWTMRQEALDHDVARVKALAYMRTMPAWRDAFPAGDPAHSH
jgi:hypothetical protein